MWLKKSKLSLFTFSFMCHIFKSARRFYDLFVGVGNLFGEGGLHQEKTILTLTKFVTNNQMAIVMCLILSAESKNVFDKFFRHGFLLMSK